MTDTQKKCANCETIKEKAEFYKNKARPDGLDVYCKECSKAKRKARMATKEGKAKHNQQSRKWRENNRDKSNGYCRKYREAHADKIREKRTSPERREYNREYMRNRRQDPCFRIRHNVSRQVHHALLREHGSKRGKSTFAHLPYTPEQLKEHLQAQFDEHMTWDNYGDYWHIDHIYPQSLLPYDSLEHPNFQKCWALENLQPLEASENIRKSNKI
jgi:hypothetical protein